MMRTARQGGEGASWAARRLRQRAGGAITLGLAGKLLAMQSFLFGLAAARAFAQASPAETPPASPPTTVSGVTVRAHLLPKVSAVTVTADWCPPPDPARYPAEAAPHVVDSYPAQGAVAPPGVLVVRLTFDAPMACYWAVTTESRDDDPCTPAGVWTLPRRTVFRMRCRVRPATGYLMRFGGVEGHDFFGMSGRPAEPYRLRFTTSDAAPTADVTGAIAADAGAPAPSPAGFVACTDLPSGATGPPCRHMAGLEDSLPERRR